MTYGIDQKNVCILATNWVLITMTNQKTSQLKLLLLRNSECKNLVV